jgi:flavin-dependent thymidylate synthase
MAASKHRVKLLNLKITPLADILSAARTCYSAKGIVLPEDFCDGLQEKEMELIESIYKAGHLTTFQHTHLHFGIENISRNCIWSFLHSHPFHNSEQVSQRYCQVKKTELFMPDGLDESGENIIGECYEYTMNAYKKLREKLLPACAAEYLKRFPGKKADDKVTVKAAEKRAQELARYVLPLGTSSRLHHTISLLTLLRYAQSATTCELPMEQTALVKLMLAEVLKHEPQLERFIPESILRHSNAEELFYKSLNVKPAPESFIREFDQSLNGLVSRLIMFSPEQESAVAETLNTVSACLKITRPRKKY